MYTCIHTRYMHDHVYLYPYDLTLYLSLFISLHAL